MKTRWMAWLAAVVISPVFAQDQTVLTEDDVWKLYSSADVKIGEVGEEAMASAGISAGGILNDTCFIGIRYGINLDESSVDGPPFATIDSYGMSTLGLETGYILIPSDVLHVQFGLGAGGGDVDVQYKNHDESAETSYFGYIEPAVDALVNLTDTCEIGVGVSYRWCFGTSLASFDDEDLSSFQGRLMVRFHQF